MAYNVAGLLILDKDQTGLKLTYLKSLKTGKLRIMMNVRYRFKFLMRKQLLWIYLRIWLQRWKAPFF